MSKFQAHKDAPDEVWLQIGYGDEGEHTWAPHQVAEDDIEEAGPYVRADRLSGRVTVSVKPLEWDVHPDHPDVQEYYAGDQNNLVGDNEYTISPHPCATGYFVIDCIGRRANEDYPSVEAAKAAAQADFEARILAAIDTAPTTSPDQIRREAARMLLADFEAETLPEHAIDAADDMHSEGDSGNTSDIIEAFLKALITGGDDD